MLDFIIADAQDLSEISKVMSESFTTILNDFKDIMLYVIKYAVPIMGLLLAITIGIKAYKHITGVDDELDAANAIRMSFLMNIMIGLILILIIKLNKGGENNED